MKLVFSPKLLVSSVLRQADLSQYCARHAHKSKEFAYEDTRRLQWQMILKPF